MKVLVDTNVLTRSAEPGHPMYRVATDALAALRAQGHGLWLVPQVLYEFWVVATRPTANNGLGRTAAEATRELAALKGLFPVPDDVPAIFAEWERLVTSIPVLGKSAHDARLVAAMFVHGVAHILTFNDADFRRFAGIIPLNPTAVSSTSPPTP